MVADIIPDMVLLSLFRIKSDYWKTADEIDRDKAPDKAQAIANLLNNLGFFEGKFGNGLQASRKSPSKKIKDSWTDTKNWSKGALYLIDGSGKIADSYMKGRLLNAGAGFTKEQIDRIKDYKTLGATLKESSERAAAELAEASKEASKLNDQMAEFEKRLADFKASPESDPQLHWGYQVARSQETELSERLAQTEKQLRRYELMVKQNDPAQGADKAAREALRRRAAAWSQKAALSREQVGQTRRELAEARKYMREVETKAAQAGERDLARLQQLGDEEQALKKLAALRGRQLTEAEKSVELLARQRQALNNLSSRARWFKDTTRKTIPPPQLFISLATLGVEVFFLYSTLKDPNATAGDAAWAAGDVAKAVADATKDMLKVQGISVVEWRLLQGSTIGKLSGQLSLRTAAGCMVWLQVISGVYSVGKYGIRGLDAFRMDDKWAVAGSSLAVLGGILTVTSALGMGLAIAGIELSASVVGVLAGLLLVAGGLIIAICADSEWESFAKHCFFSTDKSLRNRRPLNPTTLGSGEEHFMGALEAGACREQTGRLFKDCGWGVFSQRMAIQRLLARFSVSTWAAVKVLKTSYKTYDIMGSVSSVGVFDIEWSAIKTRDRHSRAISPMRATPSGPALPELSSSSSGQTASARSDCRL